jgi:hypothetical protein
VYGPCGRAPSYSGKCVARAVELYLDGVKPGYIRWDELQSVLEKEFPEEFKVKGQDRPSPETVLEWVHKHPDAPERLRHLGVQRTAPDQVMPGLALAYTGQAWPAPLLPKAGTMTGPDIKSLFEWLMALLVMAVMARCVSAIVPD